MKKSNSKLNEWKKSAALYLGSLIFNQAAYPILQTQAINSRFTNPSREIIQVQIPEASSLTAAGEPRPIDYLNIAHRLVQEEVKKKVKGKHWCRQYAEEVFDTYLKLIKTDGKDYLTNQVKFDSDIGHVWLKYKHEDNWLNFETTNRNCVYDGSNSLRSFSDANLETRAFLAGGEHVSRSSSEPGTKSFSPTPRSLTFPGGALRFLIETGLESISENGGRG